MVAPIGLRNLDIVHQRKQLFIKREATIAYEFKLAISIGSLWIYNEREYNFRHEKMNQFYAVSNHLRTSFR